jgi:hypothetical protein
MALPGVCGPSSVAGGKQAVATGAPARRGRRSIECVDRSRVHLAEASMEDDALTISAAARDVLEELGLMAPSEFHPKVPFAFADELALHGLVHTDGQGGAAITELGRLYLRDHPR